MGSFSSAVRLLRDRRGRPPAAAAATRRWRRAATAQRHGWVRRCALGAVWAFLVVIRYVLSVGCCTLQYCTTTVFIVQLDGEVRVRVRVGWVWM